jgi:hypothetical protein
VGLGVGQGVGLGWERSSRIIVVHFIDFDASRLIFQIHTVEGRIEVFICLFVAKIDR